MGTGHRVTGETRADNAILTSPTDCAVELLRGSDPAVRSTLRRAGFPRTGHGIRVKLRQSAGRRHLGARRSARQPATAAIRSAGGGMVHRLLARIAAD